MVVEDFGCTSSSEFNSSPAACQVRRLRLQHKLQALHAATKGHAVLGLQSLEAPPMKEEGVAQVFWLQGPFCGSRWSGLTGFLQANVDSANCRYSLEQGFSTCVSQTASRVS